jgi:hypothetical protein
MADTITKYSALIVPCQKCCLSTPALFAEYMRASVSCGQQFDREVKRHPPKKAFGNIIFIRGMLAGKIRSLLAVQIQKPLSPI